MAPGRSIRALLSLEDACYRQALCFPPGIQSVGRVILDGARRIRRSTLGSVVKKRRKKMRKHKYKKLLSRMRHKKK